MVRLSLVKVKGTTQSRRTMYKIAENSGKRMHLMEYQQENEILLHCFQFEKDKKTSFQEFRTTV